MQKHLRAPQQQLVSVGPFSVRMTTTIVGTDLGLLVLGIHGLQLQGCTLSVQQPLPGSAARPALGLDE